MPPANELPRPHSKPRASSSRTFVAESGAAFPLCASCGQEVARGMYTEFMWTCEVCILIHEQQVDRVDERPYVPLPHEFKLIRWA